MSESGEIAAISDTVVVATDSGNADSKKSEDTANADTYGGSGKPINKDLEPITDEDVDRIFEDMIRGLDSPDWMRLMDIDLKEASRGVNSEQLKKELLRRADKDLSARHEERERNRKQKAELKKNEEHKNHVKDQHKRGERGSRQLVNRRRTPGVTEPKFNYAKTAERPPKVPEGLKTEIKNVDEIFGKILDKWGKTPAAISRNLKKDLKKDVVKPLEDLIALIDAHRLDRMLEDEAFQNNPEVHKLRAIVEKARDAFSDYTNKDKANVLYRKRDNQPLVYITTTEKRNMVRAKIGHERNKTYHTVTPTQAVNASVFLHGKKPEIADLRTARETLELATKGTKIEIDPFLSEAPELDDRIAPINNYLSDMNETFLEAGSALKNEKLKSKLIETLMKEHGITEEEAKKILEVTGANVERALSFFDTLLDHDIAEKLVANQEMSATSE